MAITTSTERPSGTIEAVGTTTMGRDQGSTEQTDNDPVRFAESVVLSKGEVFGACQALADADRLLVRNGGKSEASALGDLFELLEARLAH
jgi:hypothetical protein